MGGRGSEFGGGGRGGKSITGFKQLPSGRIKTPKGGKYKVTKTYYHNTKATETKSVIKLK